MGIFNFVTGSGNAPKKNVFIIGDKKEILSPKQYGYHSFRWGMDNAKGLLGTICKMSQDNTSHQQSLIKRIKDNNSRLEWQLIALYSAIYLAYPQLVFRIQPFILAEVFAGVCDGVDTLANSNGSLDKQNRNGMVLLIREYFNAIVEDFNNTDNLEPGVFNTKGWKTFQTFDKYTCAAYSEPEGTVEDFSTIEKTLILQPLIDDQPFEVMLILRDKLKVIFQT